jgi:uncharacterized protein (TIGR00297 family)
MTPGAAAALAGGLALAGHVIGWLTAAGAVAANAVGAVIFAGAGLPGAALLALFFVSGSSLTYTAGLQRRPHGVRPATGRTGRQVLANGSWAALGAALAWAGHAAGWPVLVGALAAAQADTWATEIGLRAGVAPRLIASGRPVPPGTSGAVTWLGTLGGVLGAAVMAGLAVAVGIPWGAALAGGGGGVLGMLGDSVLGSTVQAVFHCQQCDERTERSVHGCGTTAQLVRGIGWLGNNAVNLAASGLGALAALLLWAAAAALY